MVVGIPCRFKYKEVEPEGFGLTAEEILQAEDGELNKFVSLKHISAYNTKGRLAMTRLWCANGNLGYKKSDNEISKKRKKLRTALKERLAREALEAEILGKELKGAKKNSKKNSETEETESAGQEDGEAAGAEASGDVEEGEGKRKRKRRKAKQNSATTESEDPQQSQDRSSATATASKSTSDSNDSKKARVETSDESKPPAAAPSNGVVKVGTNKERKLKVLESKRKLRQKLIEQSKEKAAVKKAMMSAAAPQQSAGSGDNGLKKRLDLYK